MLLQFTFYIAEIESPFLSFINVGFFVINFLSVLHYRVQERIVASFKEDLIKETYSPFWGYIECILLLIITQIMSRYINYLKSMVVYQMSKSKQNK